MKLVRDVLTILRQDFDGLKTPATRIRRPLEGILEAELSRVLTQRAGCFNASSPFLCEVKRP